MYPYHNRIRQRIKAGELVDHYFALRNMRIAVKEELTDRQREILLLYYCSTPRMTM